MVSSTRGESRARGARCLAHPFELQPETTAIDGGCRLQCQRSRHIFSSVILSARVGRSVVTGACERCPCEFRFLSLSSLLRRIRTTGRSKRILNSSIDWAMGSCEIPLFSTRAIRGFVADWDRGYSQAYHPETCTIAFRGSNELPDWIADFSDFGTSSKIGKFIFYIARLGAECACCCYAFKLELCG